MLPPLNSATSQASKFDSSQKAAAILVAMGKPAASRLLKFFKQEELKALLEAARKLRTIPQHELELIVSEFEDEFTEGAGLLDSGDQMDTILNESLPPEEFDALVGRNRPGRIEEPPSVWPKLEQLDPPKLASVLAKEHPQSIAYVFSSLSPRQSALALREFERPLRSEIFKRMLTMSPVKPAMRTMLERQLQARVSGEQFARNSSEGETRVASVLREFDKDEMEEVMDDLERSGLRNLDAVRAKLFTFEDILELSKKALVRLFDDLSSEVVVLALRNADPAIVEAVLSSLSARSRRMIESELSMAADVTDDEIQGARRTISSAALDLAAAGQLELPSRDLAA
jgi:flagellar motor switch protein FliG